MIRGSFSSLANSVRSVVVMSPLPDVVFQTVGQRQLRVPGCAGGRLPARAGFRASWGRQGKQACPLR